MRDSRVRQTQTTNHASDVLSLIDKVFGTARIEPDRRQIDPKKVDCLEIMTEAYRALEPTAKARGIMLTADTSINLPSIVANRRQLVQVLLNLGNNAIKYNVEGGWVMLSAAPCERTVRFFVRDTGRGIAREQQARIFEPFDRPDRARVSTGFGLPISRRLMHAMQGDIGFDSIPGIGSTFWVDVPVAGDEPATRRASPTAHDAPRGAAFKILYIEDKIENVELMRRVMEELDGEACCVDAETVGDGIRMALMLRPDLIITDIHLPDGTGFDVLRRLRQEPATALIPVIALTGDAMPTNLDNMRRCGFDHIVTKPFDVIELLTIIRASRKAA